MGDVDIDEYNNIEETKLLLTKGPKFNLDVTFGENFLEVNCQDVTFVITGKESSGTPIKISGTWKYLYLKIGIKSLAISASQTVPTFNLRKQRIEIEKESLVTEGIKGDVGNGELSDTLTKSIEQHVGGINTFIMLKEKPFWEYQIERFEIYLTGMKSKYLTLHSFTIQKEIMSIEYITEF